MPALQRVLICLFLTFAPWSFAEGEADIAEDASLLELEVADGRQNPQSSMRNFLVALQNDDLDAGDYLDLRNLKGEAAEMEPALLAEQFYIILTRETHLQVELLSRSPLGRDEEGVPEYRDLIMYLDTSRGEVPLFLQRVPGEGGKRIWKVSNRTVNDIPFLYTEFGYSG